MYMSIHTHMWKVCFQFLIFVMIDSKACFKFPSIIIIPCKLKWFSAMGEDSLVTDNYSILTGLVFSVPECYSRNECTSSLLCSSFLIYLVNESVELGKVATGVTYYDLVYSLKVVSFLGSC